MIHRLLRLERPLIVFDLETTSAIPQEARIVEIGFQLFTAEGLMKEYRTLVNPGMPIPSTSTSTHHITNEMVTERCAKCEGLPIEHPIADCVEFKKVPTFMQLGPRIAIGFSNCDYAGKRIRYDLQVMSAEMQRHQIEWTYADAAVIDADRLEQIGEPRTLSHLYKKHTGKTLEDAHRALADVAATTELLACQLEHYPTLPRDVRQLHELQWPGWIDSEGKFKFDDDGVPICTFGKHRNKPMVSIPSDYYKWINKHNSGFSAEIKQLTSRALLGVYPKKETVQ